MKCTYPGCINEGRYCRIMHDSQPEVLEKLPALLEKAQSVFNEFIRLRDKDKGCICCKKKRIDHAGHFFPVKQYSGVRFHELNVNGQNSQCNCFKPGKSVDPEYEVGLVARYGLQQVQQLTELAQKTAVYKWSRAELLDIIETYSAKVKQFKKSMING